MKRVVIVSTLFFNTVITNVYGQEKPNDLPVLKAGNFVEKNHANPAFFPREQWVLTRLTYPVKAGFPADYRRTHWGFFCEQEWRFEKKYKLPLKMRLGSVEYVDRMEGKRR